MKNKENAYNQCPVELYRVTHIIAYAATLLLMSAAWHTSAEQNDCDGIDTQTTGLFCNIDATPGYTLFHVLRGTGVHLIDNDGNHLWEWNEPDRLRGVTMLLTDSGTLIRNLCYDTPFCGGNGALIREYDWENNLIWQFYYPGAHHDLVRLPNGNLLFAVENENRVESIIEVKPDYLNWSGDLSNPVAGAGGTIEWLWQVSDHLVPNGEDPADFPELFHEETYTSINALDYDHERKEILMSFNSSNELMVIAHSSSTEEAAGHMGDILFRWGNPANYNMPGELKTSGQHSSKWIKPAEYGYTYSGSDVNGVGNILWFNNGMDRVDEIVPINPQGDYFLTSGVFGPLDTHWSYNFSGKFSDGRQSSAQRLPGGNTLIAFSNDTTFIEVQPDGKIVWRYVSPFCSQNEGGTSQIVADYLRSWNEVTCGDLGYANSSLVFNVKRYSANYSGFQGKQLKLPLKPLVPILLDKGELCWVIKSTSDARVTVCL